MLSRQQTGIALRYIITGDWATGEPMKYATGLLSLILLAGAAPPAAAQWLKLPGQGIPRTPDGKPNLAAPAQRRADGKPDLAGIWQIAGPKYLQNLAADFKPGELPMQPWAEAITRERMTGMHAREEPQANCLPPGLPRINATPLAFKIYQEPGVVLVLYEAFNLYRQVFLDGRELAKDLNPTWLGYSTGKWEGDTLVVDTIGFNGKTWLDQAGHPSTDALHVTERLRRRDFGHLEIRVTIDDPKAYTKPWSATEVMEWLPDTELMEFACNENNRDVEHLPGKER